MSGKKPIKKGAGQPDEIIAAESKWGNELELLCDEMQAVPELEKRIVVLEHFLIQKYSSTSEHYRIDQVQQAIALINKSKGTIDVKSLQEQTHISSKTLERAFLHYLGLLKKYGSIS